MKHRFFGAAAAMAAAALLTGCAIGAGGGASAGPNAEGEDRPGAPLVEGFESTVLKACAAEASETVAKIQERGTLHWGIGVSPPFGFKGGDGNWQGVEADNARELAALLGVEVQIQDYDYGIMTASLQSGKADIVGAQLFITAERAAAIDFSDYYYLSGQLFYVLEDSPYQTIADLDQAGVRFVYGTGNAQKAIAEKYIPQATISDAPLRGQLLLYEFLATGQADASMVEAAPMPVLLSKYTDPQLAAIGLEGRVTTPTASESEIIDPFEVAFGLPKGDDGWKSCIDAWVAEARESNRMQERIQYWLDQNIAG
ncbi:substrate-binding periplasmic protein [Ruicaihuangia caeni]|uniref:substrate-binding periplasmic protein n=1 Tax=Ruicaihuangia caeni TaxID=3042517 RepID=UPI00338F134F